MRVHCCFFFCRIDDILIMSVVVVVVLPITPPASARNVHTVVIVKPLQHGSPQGSILHQAFRSLSRNLRVRSFRNRQLLLLFRIFLSLFILGLFFVRVSLYTYMYVFITLLFFVRVPRYRIIITVASV